MRKVPLALLLAIAGCGGDNLPIETEDLTLAPPDLATPPDLARAPDLVVARSGIGEECQGGGGLGQGSCDDGQICIPDGQYGFTGGYCSQQCNVNTPCPDDAQCVPVGGPNFQFCFRKCKADPDCRPGGDYLCSPTGKVCVPASDGQSVRPGTRDGGACVTPILSPGQGLKGPFGANVQVTGSGNSVEAEPHIAVDPKSQHLVVGYIPIPMQAGDGKMGVRHSKDLGNTWDPPLLLPVDKMVNMNTDQSDPVLAVDPMGNVWMTWVGFDRSGGGRPTNMHIWAARSKTGGAMWENIYEVSPPNESPQGVVLDKPWITISPTSGAVSISWNRSTNQAVDIRLARSADQGKTWSTQTISDTGSRPQYARNLCYLTAGQDGKVYATWVELTDQQFGSTSNAVYLQRIGADGVTIGKNVRVTKNPDSPVFDDPSVAVFGNNVYVGFVSGTRSGAWDIRVATSLDGGQTFASSIKANDDPSCATHFHHQIAVDQKGSVHAIWYDNRFLTGNIFYANSGPADPGRALKFGQNLFVNDKPFTFTTRRDQSNWVGDYLGLVITNGNLYAVWTDNRLANRSHIFFAKGKAP